MKKISSELEMQKIDPQDEQQFLVG